jgi:UDP-N-acetylglucosamine 3-dehydrogenase
VLVALRAGKHVLVEKPLAVSPEDAWNLAAAGEQTSKILMVCHSQRFNPRFALMRQAVVSGEIGSIQHLFARRNSLKPAVERVLGRFPLPFWLAPHDIDMMLWTTGSPAVSVRAMSRDGGDPRADFILATIRFESGAVGVLETSWCTPGFAGKPLNEIFTVRGDAGMVEVVGHEQGLAVYSGASSVRYPDTYHAPVIHGQTEGPYRSLIRHFAGAVRDLWPPLIPADEAAAVIDVAYALQQSLESGSDVTVVRRHLPEPARTR